MVAGSFEKEARTGKERKRAGVELLRWRRGVTGEEGDPQWERLREEKEIPESQRGPIP